MKLPLHTISQIADQGVAVRQFDFGDAAAHEQSSYGSYLHRDEYYIFGIILNGELSVDIDFHEYHLSTGHMLCLCPWQVHRLVSTSELSGIGIIVDSALVDDKARHIIDRYTLDHRPAEISPTQRDSLARILDLINLRVRSAAGERRADIILHLTQAAVDIVTEVIADNDPSHSHLSRRHQIVATFNDLLSKHMTRNRRPSFYADRLNISTVYLNQTIKAATGMNTGNYIRERIMLEAKRMLVYSTLAVGEIAARLGFDDYTYFTRTFTLSTGMSPVAFRRKYID